MMYEYKAVRWKANWADNLFEKHNLTSSDAESLENLCNLYGANGWELIQIKERHYHGCSGKISILIFKRPLKKQHGNDTSDTQNISQKRRQSDYDIALFV